MRAVVGTTAYYVGTVWFAVVALIDRALAWCPRRWTP